MRRTLRFPGFPLLVLLLAASLLAGLGMRDPHPADEPRFVLVAAHMVESGDWLFPRRGTELYADKPPVFMWLLAAARRITGDWRTSFLLPSWIAALLVLWLTHDLARRLWNRTAGRHALLALFACLQFGLQARRAQIDMVLLAMMMLSLWALAQYVLQRRDPRLLALGAFAAGLGTVTKGVGFLPLLVLAALPWPGARRPSPALPGGHPGRHVVAGVAGFLAGAGLWLVPMLAAVLRSDDPQLRAYAADILWKQTGTRYADPWHHLKPAWYYLQVMATLWLPGALLLPWLLPAWWRRLRRGDPRWWLLLGWAALVLGFFSISPAKRDVYLLPVLPVLAIAAAPLLPGLLRHRGVRLALATWLAVLAIAALAAGLAAWPEPAAWWQRIGARHEAGPEVLAAIGRWLVVLGAWTAGCLAWAAWSRLRRVGTATLLAMAGLWTIHGIGLMPAIDAGSSARALMQQVDGRIGPQAELGLLAWREQHLLQAGRDTAVFGFNRPWPAQWREAGAWLAAAPERRWLFVLEEALDPCVDRARAERAGVSNRRTWWLVPGTAMVPDCTVGAATGADERRANAQAMPGDAATD